MSIECSYLRSVSFTYLTVAVEDHRVVSAGVERRPEVDKVRGRVLDVHPHYVENVTVKDLILPHSVRLAAGRGSHESDMRRQAPGDASKGVINMIFAGEIFGKKCFLIARMAVEFVEPPNSPDVQLDPSPERHGSGDGGKS